MLAFELQAGFSAWLQFTVLPGGPLFMGTMAPSNAEGYISDKEFQVRSHCNTTCNPQDNTALLQSLRTTQATPSTSGGRGACTHWRGLSP